MSQLSETSTIPFELSQNQDELFVEDLTYVDQLYFQHRFGEFEDISVNENSLDLLVDDHQQNLSDINYESDVDELEILEESVNDIEKSCVLEYSEFDIKEKDKQILFKTSTCGCSQFYKGQSCSEYLNFDAIVNYREYCNELSRDELDLVVKSQIVNQRLSGTETSSNKHKLKERVRPRQKFFFQGNRICRKTFCFLHNIDKEKLQAITRSLDEDGFRTRVHGNTGKSPHNSLSFEDRNNIKKFILKYAADNALPLPGRLPNFSQARVLLLPADKRQADIHTIYQEVARESGHREISLSSFSRLWRDLCPHVVLAKPQTDLCFKCQQYSVKVQQSGSLEEVDKIDLLAKYNEHLKHAKLERDFYRERCIEAKAVYSEHSPVEGADHCSLKACMHYSWDYAQQVHYPHHSQQVGPIYFKTPKKCEVFGICCEGTGKQTFYLSDEGQSPGKGANTVVSQVHHYLQHYGLGEEEAYFHFDNCAGQNKNNIVLQYAIWRVITGLHKKIHYGLMVAGHTKFEPDWHFGLWKARWRFTDAETIEEIAQSVQDSSRSGHNAPHLVGGEENGVLFYDWKTFLGQYFKSLKNITQYQHFSVSIDDPGVVVCSLRPDSEMVEHNLLKGQDVVSQIKSGVFPNRIYGTGLSSERQWYLYTEISQFFHSESSRNTVCPKPITPKETCSRKRKCPE